MLGFKVDFSTDDGMWGCLSTILRIKDPLGLAAPFLLRGEKILQMLAVQAASWNKKLPEETKNKWDEWHDGLLRLNELKIQRCYRSKSLGEIASVTLHCFSDASFVGYGVACYLRWVDMEGKVEVSLVMGKSRVSPETDNRSKTGTDSGLGEIAAVLTEEHKLDDLETFFLG